MPTKIPFKLILSGAAFIALSFSLHAPHELRGWLSALIALLSGYLFGLVTCHIHSRTRSIVTVLLFGIVNLAHSILDGINLVQNTLSVGLHEVARLPAVALTLGAIINRPGKYVLALLLTLGTWLLGLWLGHSLLGTTMSEFEWLEYTSYILLGDIIHHIIEEVQKYRRPGECCHS